MNDPSISIAAALAKHFEGLSLKPYHDPVGFPTIGYGHLLSRIAWEPLDKWPALATEADAGVLLMADMEKKLEGVRRLVRAELNDNQEAAVLDFAFNCGVGNLQASTLRQKLNREEFDSASDEFGRWVYADGKKLNGLIRRRFAERELFLS